MPTKPKSITRRTVKCKHVHLSGRRCSIRVGKKDAFGNPQVHCSFHRGPDCIECDSMLQAFPIRSMLEDGL